MLQEDLDIIFQCCKCTPAEQPSDDNLQQPMEDDIEEDQQIQYERCYTNNIQKDCTSDTVYAIFELYIRLLQSALLTGDAVSATRQQTARLLLYRGDRPSSLDPTHTSTQMIQGKKEAAVNAYKSASEIVEEKMEEILSDDDFNLPKPANLTRAINRFRQQLRPQAPTDLYFEEHGQQLSWCIQLLTSKGCSFHWSKAVMRKVATLGLKTAYNQKKSTHHFIRKVLALPFLPAAHIRPTFMELLQTTTNSSQQIKELMTYLSRTWFASTVWSVQQWSVYHQSVRTNNDVEGWHRRFNQRAGRTQLHFYRIVPAFRKEAKTVKLQHRLVSEQQLTRYQRVQYKRMQGRITTLWERLDAKTLKTSDFLKEVSNLYAPPVPGPADLVLNNV